MSRLSPEPASIDGADFKFAIVAARYNQEYVDGLLDGVLSMLSQAGLPDEQVDIERVPGSNELPIAAQMIAGSGKYDVIIA